MVGIAVFDDDDDLPDFLYDFLYDFLQDFFNDLRDFFGLIDLIDLVKGATGEIGVFPALGVPALVSCFKERSSDPNRCPRLIMEIRCL